MIGTDSEAQALADYDLYTMLITHREAYHRISWLNYDTLNRKTIAFIPPEGVMALYRKDYETMQEQMIYGESIPFDNLILRLQALQDKIRNW